MHPIDLSASAWQYRRMKQLRKLLKRVLIWSVAAILLLTAAKILPDRQNAAVRAFAKGDYTTAAKFWTKLARSGDQKAQINLGLLYSRGEGVEQDLGKAHELFLSAAENGNPVAQYLVAHDYAVGAGVTPSPKVSLMWLREAADQDYPPAQIALGRRYMTGEGVPQDLGQADYWLRRAEETLPVAGVEK